MRCMGRMGFGMRRFGVALAVALVAAVLRACPVVVRRGAAAARSTS